VVVSRINRMMVSVTNEEKLFREVCDITVDYGQLRMVWIGLVDENFSKIIPTVACGHEEGYLDIIKNINVHEPDLREGPTGRALRTGTHVICNDIASDPFMKPWANEALARGYRSSMAIPFRKFGKVMGTLNLYASIPEYFNKTEVSLLLETAEGISFTLENFEREKLRLRAEAELIKVYKEKETVLNRINDAVVSLDATWHYTFLNDAAHSTHPPFEQTIGKTIWEIHPELKDSVFGKTYHEAMDTQTVQEIEAYHPPMQKWFFAKAYPAEDGITIFFKDITERKLAERQIFNEKQISESIINSLPGIFYLYNKAGIFSKWNKNFETVSGYTADEISKSHPVDYFSTAEKIRLVEKINEVFEIGEATITANFLSKNGTETPYYLTGRKIVLDQVEYLIGTGIDITDRVFAENELIKRNGQILELTKNLEKIREEERTRIAREIHDELGQQLTALKMDAAWVQKKISSIQPESNQRLTDMIQLIDETIKSLRRISSELRPSILDDLGLIAALEWQSEDFSKRTAINVHFTNKVADFNPDPHTATQVFRIFQESLTNIARHAEATEVSILLEQDEPAILLHITDNGKGFDLDEIKQRKTLGMLGMRERTLLFNGNLTINTAPGKGTKLTIKIPPQQN
jgi:PAS domain S-box-containing protein